MRKDGGSGEPREEAFRHVIRHRSMLMAYVRAIVHDPELAEDTLGDVSVAIARNWTRYDKSRPFAPWARGVARRVALANLRKHGRRPVLLDSDVLETVAVELDCHADRGEAERRKQALDRCIRRLSDFNRRLVRMRYSENCPTSEIAQAVNWTVDSLYVAFSRIHKALRECVQRNLETT